MKIQLVFLAIVASLLAACNQEKPLDKIDLTVQVQGNEATQFVGKPHAPVSMQYQFLTTPALNETLEIRLEFRVERDTEMLEVKYKAQAGLTSTVPVQPYLFNNLPKGAVETITLRVVPEQTGLRYINVFASIDVNNIMQSRSFAVPVNIELTADQLGSKTSGAVNKLGQGMKHLPEQNVISMPAVETTE